MEPPEEKKRNKEGAVAARVLRLDQTARKLVIRGQGLRM
jgi:hypothetical protein